MQGQQQQTLVGMTAKSEHLRQHSGSSNTPRDVTSATYATRFNRQSMKHGSADQDTANASGLRSLDQLNREPTLFSYHWYLV
jgi:hypothetical protein